MAQQWQYRSGRSACFREDIDHELKLWAEDGWELVSTAISATTDEVIYFWRRPVG